MQSSITRREIFNSAHRLYLPDLTDDQNFEIFGKCSYPNYHGHNYEVHVTIIGEIDSRTGFVYDIAKLKQIMKSEILEPYDHRNLNLDTVDFETIIPTVENITKMIYTKMRAKIESEYTIKVKVYETIRNYSEFPM